MINLGQKIVQGTYFEAKKQYVKHEMILDKITK